MRDEDKLLMFAKAVDDFDSEDAARVCSEQNEPPHCLDCNGEYRMETGDNPTPTCDGCAHSNVTELSRALLAAHADNERMRGELAQLRNAANNAANLLEANTDKSMRRVGAGFIRRELAAIDEARAEGEGSK